MALKAGILNGTDVVARPVDSPTAKREIVLAWRRNFPARGRFLLLAGRRTASRGDSGRNAFSPVQLYRAVPEDWRHDVTLSRNCNNPPLRSRMPNRRRRGADRRQTDRQRMERRGRESRGGSSGQACPSERRVGKASASASSAGTRSKPSPPRCKSHRFDRTLIYFLPAIGIARPYPVPARSPAVPAGSGYCGLPVAATLCQSR